MLQYVQRSNIIYEKEINHIIVVFITLFFVNFCAVITNPLSVNPTKWSNTLKQFVGNSRQII